MATELAKGYVQIIPSTEGIAGSIAKVLNPESEKAGKSAGKNIGSSIASGIAAATKVGAALLGAAATGISAVGAKALDAYASFEQLTGGVETLFGAQGMSLQEYAKDQGKSIDEVRDKYNELMDTQTDVQNNAKNAWKTAGMSTNEYMETVNGFAASLTKSLGEYSWQAGNMADQAVQDMADNAAKMGTSMESIQNAYGGFAKQNYTMLDNLKLGYGGTKAEMERLLRDAEKMAGYIEGSLDIESFADITEAIHIVQENMGITGTTAKEAMFTIEGSANATKAAWENALTAIAGGGNLDESIDSMITAVFGGEDGGGLLNNVLPRIETIMGGIGQFIGQASPYIEEYIPPLITSLVPPLVSSAATLVGAIITGIAEATPELIKAGIDMARSIAKGLEEECPALAAVLNGVADAVEWLTNNMDIAVPVVTGLVAAFVVWKTAMTIASLISAVTKATKGMTAAQVAANVAQKILNATMLANPFVLIASLVAGLAVAIIALWNTNEDFRNGVIAIWNGVKEAFSSAVDKVNQDIETAKTNFTNMKNSISQTFDGIEQSIVKKINSAKESVGKAVEKIKGFFNFQWKLPDLKLPHFSMTGSFSLKPPSVPKLSVDWYDKGGIFSSPSIIGVGEKRPEFVGALDDLRGIVREESGGNNVEIEERIFAMLERYLPGMANMRVVMDTGATVGALAPAMDDEIGWRTDRNNRGV